MPGNNETVYAFSLDYDGCFSPLDNATPLTETHKAQLDLIKAIIKNKRSIIYIGTNRQCSIDDSGNSYSKKNGSAYPRYQEIATYLESPLCTDLMPDLYNDLEPGTTFKEAFDLLDTEQKDYETQKYKMAMTNHTIKNWLFDESKLSILYYQIHHFSSQHIAANKKFYFYDDTLELLTNLHEFFKKHPDFLPKGLTLHLESYPAVEGKLFEPIYGTGKIDGNYKTTILSLMEKALQSENYQEKVEPKYKGKIPITTLVLAKDARFNFRLPLIEYFVPLTDKTEKATASSSQASSSEAAPSSSQASSSLTYPGTLFQGVVIGESCKKAWTHGVIPP